jgi:hypothetical protein
MYTQSLISLLIIGITGSLLSMEAPPKALATDGIVFLVSAEDAAQVPGKLEKYSIPRSFADKSLELEDLMSNVNSSNRDSNTICVKTSSRMLSFLLPLLHQIQNAKPKKDCALFESLNSNSALIDLTQRHLPIKYPC